MGGAAWFDDDFKAASVHYQGARGLDAPLGEIGPRLSDTLMHTGEFAKALKVNEAVQESGVDRDWREFARTHVLRFLVSELDVSNQDRQAIPDETRSDISAMSRRDLIRMLKRYDALDASVWGALQAQPGSKPFTELVAAAYLVHAAAPWIEAAVVASEAGDDKDVQHLIAAGLDSEADYIDQLDRLAEKSIGERAATVRRIQIAALKASEATPAPAFQFVDEMNIRIDFEDLES